VIVECPHDDELRRLMVGPPNDAVKLALSMHVAECAACRQRLEQLVAHQPSAEVSGTDGRREPLAAIPRDLEQTVYVSKAPDAYLRDRDVEKAADDTPTPAQAGGATPTRQHQDHLGAALTKFPQPAVTVPGGHPDGGVTIAAGQLVPPAGPHVTAALPASLGRYEIRRVLGKGGFGTVYLGHDTQLDRPVAIKVVQPRADFPRAAPTEFLEEARRLARLRHPGIVAVHDVGVHDGQVYTVADFIDGPDLGRWLVSRRPSWPDAARLTAAVADALAHAHERMIVHRDVKPANILLSTDGTPVLVDFGLALDQEHAGGREKGTISGTPWYMSPEQAAGTAHRIDGRTDIYSLGVVLFELLTGRVPFAARELRELIRQLREDEPQPPRQLVRDLPADLERACLKAMAKRDADRYTTAADFAAELRHVLATADPTLANLAARLTLSAVAPTGVTPTGVAPTGVAPTGVAPASSRHEPQTPPSSQQRVRGAELRQVTVLTCGSDVFESDAYLHLGAEHQARVLQAFERECTTAIAALDGTIVQCNERGLVACFGYPVAHEDTAQRAARAGLGLHGALRALGEQLGREHNLELSAWVAIHTGPAFVEMRENSVSLVGEARNLAVRMDAAAAGRLVCSEATRRLIRGQFQCAEVGRHKIRGVAQPVLVFEIQAALAARSNVEASGPAALTPLTGRDHEVSLLQDRWERAQEGTAQVVCVVGEAGLGKSRLVYTLKQRILEEISEGTADAPVIEWRCAPHFQNTGLYPVIDFFERALAFCPEEAPAARLERLLRRLEQDGLAQAERVPLWAALLSLPCPAGYPPAALSPARQREETFRALVDWLHVRATRARTTRRPMLFVVEDLHWADASTLELLGQYLAECDHDAILAVLTARPGFHAPWPARPDQTTLALTRLTRRQVGELVRKKAGVAVPEAMIAQVYDRAGGVPLYVEEFTQMVQESGRLQPTDDAAAPEAVLPPREIPATLQDLMMARLDRMTGERELAQLAAVLGREFSHEVLAAVANVDERTLESELVRLAQVDIVHAKGRPPRCSYLFKHALLEDALYNTLVQDKRRELHRRVGDVLAARFPQTVETQPELLGHHYTEAGEVDKAVRYWLQAGQRSRERSAEREAVHHLTRGLTLLQTLPQTPERDRRELQFLSALGSATIAVRGYAAPEIGPMMLRARALCEQAGDQLQSFGILLGTWEWHLVRGDVRLCVDLAAEGVAIADRLDDPGVRMEALFMPGVTDFYRGRFAQARAAHERALAEYDDRERTKAWTAYTGHNASVTHRCYLALDLWQLGFPDQALRLDQETRALARAIGHAFTIGHAADFSACLHQFCRLGAAAQAAADEELTVAADQGFQLWHALGTLHRAAGICLQGSAATALPLLLKGYRAFRATGAALRVPYYLGILAEAYMQLGRFDEAQQALEEGLALAEKTDDQFAEAELQRLRGELILLTTKDAAAAERCYRSAIETARRQGSRAWELRAAISLARLRQQQDGADDALRALAAVYSTYTEGLSTPDLVDAAALLAATSR
jgi:serine/threonine protein kinase/tetratricopeptide (TPR) repeat protein